MSSRSLAFRLALRPHFPECPEAFNDTSLMTFPKTWRIRIRTFQVAIWLEPACFSHLLELTEASIEGEKRGFPL